MDDLISRAALLSNVDDLAVSDCEVFRAEALRLIADAPTVAAVPVVRCGECRHSSRIAQDTTDRMRHCWSGRGRNNGDGFSRVKQDGYCDDGERRKERDDG